MVCILKRDTCKHEKDIHHISKSVGVRINEFTLLIVPLTILLEGTKAYVEHNTAKNTTIFENILLF